MRKKFFIYRNKTIFLGHTKTENETIFVDERSIAIFRQITKRSRFVHLGEALWLFNSIYLSNDKQPNFVQPKQDDISNFDVLIKY